MSSLEYSSNIKPVSIVEENFEQLLQISYIGGSILLWQEGVGVLHSSTRDQQVDHFHSTFLHNYRYL